MRSAFTIAMFVVLGAQVASAEKEVERFYEPNVGTWFAVTLSPEGDWEDYSAFRSAWRDSNEEWIVRRENGEIDACLRDPNASKPVITPAFDTTIQMEFSTGPASLFARVDDGWIAAYGDTYRHEESVYWFDETGKNKRPLSKYNIHQFLFDGDRLFAVEGHSDFWGSMLQLRKEQGRWVCEKFVSLPEEGKAMAIVAPGDYVVLTSTMLLRINLRKEMKILIPNGDDWIDANSIALDDNGTVYIGMRQFVVRCKLDTSVLSYEYLAPDKTWLPKGLR